MKFLANSLLIMIILTCFTKTDIKKQSSINQIENGDVLISLNDSISFHWDNQKYKFVEDSLWKLLENDYQNLEPVLIDLILDTNESQAKICSIERNLYKGDLSFLVLDKINNLPYIDIFHTQWDSFDVDCNYPGGMLWYINKNRSEIKQSVSNYLLTR